MTTNYHTPIETGAAVSASVVNAPLSELDAAISSISVSQNVSTTSKTLAAQFDKLNETMSAVPGLSFDLVAGHTYSFRGLFQTEADGGGAVFGLYGTCTPDSFFAAGVMIDSGISFYANVDINAINNTVVGYSTFNALVMIEGIVVVNSDGTLYPTFSQFAENANPSSVLAGIFTVVQIG